MREHYNLGFWGNPQLIAAQPAFCVMEISSSGDAVATAARTRMKNLMLSVGEEIVRFVESWG